MTLKPMLVACAIFILIGACDRSGGTSAPREVLERYIGISFSVGQVQDRKKMEALLTGDALQRLTALSDDDFTRTLIKTPRRFLSLKVLESRKVSDREFALTYEISFEEGEKEKKVLISQRKLCSVVSETGSWKIKEVRSLRESMEYVQELGLP